MPRGTVEPESSTGHRARSPQSHSRLQRAYTSVNNHVLRQAPARLYLLKIEGSPDPFALPRPRCERRCSSEATGATCQIWAPQRGGEGGMRLLASDIRTCLCVRADLGGPCGGSQPRLTPLPHGQAGSRPYCACRSRVPNPLAHPRDLGEWCACPAGCVSRLWPGRPAAPMTQLPMRW
jgi:hypothetical protein